MGLSPPTLPLAIIFMREIRWVPVHGNIVAGCPNANGIVVDAEVDRSDKSHPQRKQGTISGLCSLKKGQLRALTKGKLTFVARIEVIGCFRSVHVIR